MASPDIADLITQGMTLYTNTRTYSLGQTPVFAAGVNEAPGLMFDPVTGGYNITADSLRWKNFWSTLFEVTTQTLILMYHQSLDLNRAKAFVQKLRNYVQYQDAAVFNLNQIA